jgi:hypothetical protein
MKYSQFLNFKKTFRFGDAILGVRQLAAAFVKPMTDQGGSKLPHSKDALFFEIMTL